MHHLYGNGHRAFSRNAQGRTIDAHCKVARRTHSHALHYPETKELAVFGDLGRRMQVVGRENLPANDEPAVYVANHQSFLVSAQPMP